MKLVIVSGRSGSGKSSVLNQLEDEGFYCIDNLPVSLLNDLIEKLLQPERRQLQNTAICIDARNSPGDLASFTSIIQSIKSQVELRIIYLDADDQTLIKRFSETRRRHPLSSKQVALAEALHQERATLEPIVLAADLIIDTSNLNHHGLRDAVRERIVGADSPGMTVLIQSFGFKRGVPVDADFIFDIRMLPNPHWDVSLRAMTGLDQGVKDFLADKAEVQEMFDDIYRFLKRWVPQIASSNRSYTTIAIGCTGGRHRSVYLAEKLASALSGELDNLQVRHRELS